MIVAIDQFDKSCWLIGNIAARRQIRMKLAFHETAVTCTQWVAETQDALAPVIASAWSVVSRGGNGARCRSRTV